MKHILVLLTFLIPVTGFAQTNFQPAQVVTVSGENLDGFIDYRDWSRNPSEIQFVRSMGESPVTFTPGDILEFTVGEQRYISRRVTIDETPIKVPRVEVTLPKSREDQVFLKVLVDGELSLYQYQGLRSNFYVEEMGKITELISHEIVVNQRSKFILVDTFKDEYIRQLENLNTDCSHVSTRKLDYSESRLTGFVATCNLEPGEELPEALKQLTAKKKGEFRISPVLSMGSYATDYGITTSRLVNRTDPFGNPVQVEILERSDESVQILALMIGAEVAYYLPGDLSTRAIVTSFSFSPMVWENEDAFPSATLINISAGYRFLFQSEGFQPFVEPGLSAFVRTGDYYSANGNERLIMGLRLGFGFQYERLWSVVRIDLHNKRYEQIRQDGIAVALGIQL